MDTWSEWLLGLVAAGVLVWLVRFFTQSPLDVTSGGGATMEDVDVDIETPRDRDAAEAASSVGKGASGGKVKVVWTSSSFTAQLLSLVLRRRPRIAKPSHVRVFYATDRVPDDPSGGRAHYGVERDSTLHFGAAEVSIPSGHKRGTIERPRIWRFEFRENPNKHIVITRVVETSEAEFFSEVDAAVAGTESRSPFVFVHGFNVSFDEALLRAGQLAADLDIFIPIAYSWPSRDKKRWYDADGDAIAGSAARLHGFLSTLAQLASVRTVHVIAHSMGSRAVAGIMGRLQTMDRIGEIVLAAPDIDRLNFEQDTGPLLAAGRVRTTLYASAYDAALLLSKANSANYSRLGDAADGICVLPGMETVDVSAVSKGILGHALAFEVRAVVEDMRALLGRRASARHRALKLCRAPNGDYWEVPP